MFTWSDVVCHRIVGNKAYYYDYAEYLGELIPDIQPFKELKIKASCYLLKCGNFAWSFNSKVYTKKELLNYELIQILPPIDIQPVISHIIYDDYNRMQKMKRKYSVDGLIDIYKKNKIQNIIFQHD